MGQSALADIKKPATQALAPLGYTVFWRLAGIKVSHTDLVSLLQQTGFEAYLPERPSSYTALRRALLTWNREYGRPDLLLRVVTKQPLVFALVQEAPDQQQLDLTH